MRQNRDTHVCIDWRDYRWKIRGGLGNIGNDPGIAKHPEDQMTRRSLPGTVRSAIKRTSRRPVTCSSLHAIRVQKVKSAGKSMQEAIAGKPFADLDPVWGNGIINGDQRVQIVYLTL